MGKSSTEPQKLPIDFLVVTPLEEERDALLDKLPGWQKIAPSEQDVQVYFQSALLTTFPNGSTSVYQIVVMPLVGMGRVQAAMATKDAIRQWHPRHVILVGIAGGVAAKGVELGDVLVADKIVDYELQKQTAQGLDIRWEVYNASPRLLGAARNLIGESWSDLSRVKRPQRGQPKRHIGPIASGDKVVDFAEALNIYRETWSKLIGTEMEAGGVAASAFQSVEHAEFFMIRGVSDLADGDKNNPQTEKWRPYACDIAAAYTVALLKSGPVPPISEDVSVAAPRQETVHSDIEESFSKPSLDTQVLRTLYAYYQMHKGERRMNLNELVTACRADRQDILQCLLGLEEKRWLEYDVTVAAEAGVVWLTALGIKVAKDIYGNKPGKQNS